RGDGVRRAGRDHAWDGYGRGRRRGRRPGRHERRGGDRRRHRARGGRAGRARAAWARTGARVPLGRSRRRDRRRLSRGGGLSEPLVLIDADVLGRHRTGDETYVEQLLRALPQTAPDLRIAALTRDAALVPDGVEPVILRARTQELRMALGVPRVLRRLRPALAHFVHSLPLSCPAPALLTVQDLSWERDPTVFGRWDLITFKVFVRRSVRRARHVFAISARTKR